MATAPKRRGNTTRQPETTSALPLTAEEGRPAAWTRAQAWDQVLRTLDAQSERPPYNARGFAEFELDFEQALMRQLGPYFEHLPALELTRENIKDVVEEKARGAYYLILGDQLVYIGKSDAKAGLQARLLRHHKTLKRRKGIDWAQMKFKAVKVASLAALDTESLLLRLHELTGAAGGGDARPEWNFSGFGSNDPGVRRDTQRVSLFDQKYPLDLDTIIDFEDLPPAGVVSLETYAKWLRKQLKFTFRLQTKHIVRAVSLGSVQVDVGQMIASNRLQDLLLKIHEVLPAGWVLTVLRGKAVLYRNDRRDYKSPLWRLESGQPAGTPNYTLGDVGDGGAVERLHGDDDGSDQDDAGEDEEAAEDEAA